MSLLGETINRAIDVLVNVYAINSLGGPFYSFNTTTGSPLMSSNITHEMILQYVEYSDLVQLYTLVKMNKIQFQFSRSSNSIASGNDLVNTPNIFFQCSTVPKLSNSVTDLPKIAQADNSVECDLQTFRPRAWDLILPPSIVAINRYHNDIYTFGSDVWLSTTLNGVQQFPDLFLNLGALTQPTFTSTSSASNVLVGQMHIRFQLTFAGPKIA